MIRPISALVARCTVRADLDIRQVYERSRHGVSDPALVKHMRQMMLDFTMSVLHP